METHVAGTIELQGHRTLALALERGALHGEGQPLAEAGLQRLMDLNLVGLATDVRNPALEESGDVGHLDEYASRYGIVMVLAT